MHQFRKVDHSGLYAPTALLLEFANLKNFAAEFYHLKVENSIYL